MKPSLSQLRQPGSSVIADLPAAEGSSAADSGPVTSVTLLNRLQHWDDTAAWKLFFERYQTLLNTWSRQSLGNPADVDEVNQQVYWEVARRLTVFHYDSSRSFRGWLKKLHNSRLLDFLKIQRRRELREVEVARVRTHGLACRPANPTTDVPAKQLAETNRQLHVNGVIEAVRSRVTDRTWAIFEDIALHGQTVAETARRHKMKYAATFAAWSRTCQMLRQESESRLAPPERSRE
ncbi:MAG: hypothetical protein U0996_18445 [Planctomycetaceae bacterium]